MRSALIILALLLLAAPLALAQDADLNAALITAAYQSNYSQVQRLLAEGADPNAQDEGSWSALLISSSNGNAYYG